MTSLVFSYDAIADVYSTDMGRSMPFDDIGWYRKLCLERGGRVLELGCGTGRILIELLAAGIDAVGVDRSLPMLQRLQRDAGARGIVPSTAQMDLRQLAVSGPFRIILAPYSLITYLTDPAVATEVLDRLGQLLETDGRIIVDAFIPQPVETFVDYRLDYRREYEDGMLERYKKITANVDGTNGIARRYRIVTADGNVKREIITAETIRPYSPRELGALADAAELEVDYWTWDYGARETENGARFATAVLRRDSGDPKSRP